MLILAKSPADPPSVDLKNAPTEGQQQQPESGMRVIAVNSPILFKSDLETSVRSQEPPSLELEHVGVDQSRVNLKLPNAIKGQFEALWRKTLQNSLASLQRPDEDAALDIRKSYINDTAILISELNLVEIDGKRFLDNDSALAAKLVNELAITRAKELWEMNQALSRNSVNASTSQ